MSGAREVTRNLIMTLFAKVTKSLKKEREFYFDIFVVLSFHGLIYLVYRALGITSACIMVLGMIREGTLILLIFWTINRLRRIVFGVSISLGFGLQMLILEQLSVVVICIFCVLFLLLLGVIEFFFLKGKSFLIEILYFFLLLSPHLFIDLQWSFHFAVMLFFLCLMKVIFNLINMDFSYSFKSLFITLLCLIVYIFCKCNFPFQETNFYIQILFLMAGSFVIYFCFLSERGYELAITSLSYISMNIYIARLITDNDTVFERCTIVYISVLLFLFMFLYILSIKKKESLTEIFNNKKVQILITLLLFLDPILSSLCIEVNTQYTWVWDWLLYFKLEIGVFGLLHFYFDEQKSIIYIIIKRKTRLLNTCGGEKGRNKMITIIKE